MSDSNNTTGNKPNLLVRVAVIAGMLLILFFIAAAIVKYVPKIISSISPANVSLTSMFNGNETASSTNASVEDASVENKPTKSSTTLTNTPASTKQVSEQTKAPTKTYTPAPNYNYYRPAGPSDLAITLIKVGQINADGTYIQSSTIQPGSRVQVQFTVTNTGSGRSGNWNLHAVLPTSIPAEKLYTSVTEPALNSGDAYQMTLAFDSYDPSQTHIQITLSVPGDANALNNVLLIPVTPTYNYNNNNCYWSNGNYNCNNNQNNNGCYYSNGSYICNNNNSNNCYWNNGYYNCNNNNSNNGCYYSNGSYYCTGAITGNSDLSVIITNVGTMDRNTGQFYYTNSSSFNRYDKVAVQFTVTNLGSVSSGNWTFNASLPSSSNSTYASNTQSSIAPGQTMSFTIGFDYPNAGTQNFSVQLYPQSTELNSSNNYASKNIYVNN